VKCYLSSFVLELILSYCFTRLIKTCLTPLVFMSSESVGKPLSPSGNLLSLLSGLRRWKSPIVLSASRRVVALLGNAVVLGRE